MLAEAKARPELSLMSGSGDSRVSGGFDSSTANPKGPISLLPHASPNVDSPSSGASFGACGSSGGKGGGSGGGGGCRRGGVVSAGVLASVAEHGGWLWGDGLEPPIFHLDGRVFLSCEERKARGIPDKDARYKIANHAAAAARV